MKLTIVLIPVILWTTSSHAQSKEPMVFNYSCNVCIFPPGSIGDGCDVDKNSYRGGSGNLHSGLSGVSA